MNLNTYKKFKVGETYCTNCELLDERLERVPAGTKVRLVAIAAKVRLVPPALRDGKLHDGLSYFYNAVRADQVDFWENYSQGSDLTTGRILAATAPIGARIRANFCTLVPGN